MKGYLKLITLLFLFASSYNANCQETLKEKIARKKAELEAKLSGGRGGLVTLDPNVSQSVMAAKWEDKEYEKYQSDVSTPENEKISVKIGKTEENKSSIWLGDIEYRSDEYGKSDFVRYYKTTGGGHFQVVFTESKIILFTTDLSGSSRVKFFISNPGRYSDLEAVKEFLSESKVNQEADLALYAKNKKASDDAAFKEKKAEWSIEGKDVVKIEIMDVRAAHKFGYFRSFNFDVKATLKNGKTISTKDGGFWSDYSITYGDTDYKGGTIEPIEFIKNDKIVVTVYSKFDKSLKATTDVVLNYDEQLYFSNNAKNWGTSANDYKIEIKQVKHASNGTDILMYRVTDLDGYDPVKVFKLRADQTFNFTTDGANGRKVAGLGNQTGPGGNGGDAGNITVIKDPSVTSYDLNYSMKGGNGGAGTYGQNRGNDGRDGTFKEVVRAVSF